MDGIPAGTPVIVGIIAYFQTGFLHSFNTQLRAVKDTIADILGKNLPNRIEDLVNVTENLLRYTQKSGAVH